MKLTTKIKAGAAVAVAITCLSTTAFAGTISNSQITPSAPMGSWNGYTIDQMADGNSADTSPFNGYTTDAASGTIRLDLVGGPYDLSAFNLWNDVNVRAEGVSQFRLRFYDTSGSSTVSSTYTTVPGTTAVQTFNFTPVTNIVRVDMEVISSISQSNSYRRRIEIREVTFTGDKTEIAVHMPGEHFQCYRVEKGDNLKTDYISVQDQFGRAQLVLGRPMMLCNPSSKMHGKNYYKIENEKRHLVCYNIVKEEGQTRNYSLKINNQFAPDDIVSSKRQMFCVPSSKKHTDRVIGNSIGNTIGRPIEKALPAKPMEKFQRR